MFFFSSRRRHTRCGRDWSSDVCSSDLFALSPLLGTILSGVPSRDVGAASGVVSTSMQIGNTVGISLFGLLFYRFLNSQLSSTPISYLDSFKMTLPFLIIPSVSSFIIVFLLSQHRARQIIHRLEA